MQGKWLGLKALRYGLLLAVSVATLSGCVSAVSNDMRADMKPAQESDETVADAGTDDTTTPATAAVAKSGASQDAYAAADAGDNGAAMTGQQGEGASDRAGLVMQSTTLNAGRSSIYSNGTQAVATGNAYSATGGANAAVNSLYAGTGAAEGADQSGRLPVEDMPPVDSSAQQQQRLETLGDEQAVVLPENVPIPKTARMALVNEGASGNAADLALAAETGGGAVAVPETQAQAALGQTQAKNQPHKTVTLASLFSGKRDARAQVDGEGFSAQPRRVLNRDSAGTTQKASLGTLPGVSTAGSLFSNDHSEAEEVDDDSPPQFKEVASLAGLARLAPNGLWLQTEKVKTGCFKPELLQALKTIEKHYDKPIIVTSGLRDVKVNRAKQSLHTRCEAADIQIAGVGKWELAEYLRSMPGRGGVGTYCHTESVHIDIGPERDWNWRCRRRK